MVKFNDIIYSLLREFRNQGFDISDEESQSAGEENILLVVDGTQAVPLTFNKDIEAWRLAITMVGRGSSKDELYELLDKFCELTHRGCVIPVYSTDGIAVLTVNGFLEPTGPVLTTLPYSWQFTQQFNLEVKEEAK